jgi:hypothetical protein
MGSRDYADEFCWSEHMAICSLLISLAKNADRDATMTIRFQRLLFSVMLSRSGLAWPELPTNSDSMIPAAGGLPSRVAIVSCKIHHAKCRCGAAVQHCSSAVSAKSEDVPVGGFGQNPLKMQKPGCRKVPALSASTAAAVRHTTAGNTVVMSDGGLVAIQAGTGPRLTNEYLVPTDVVVTVLEGGVTGSGSGSGMFYIRGRPSTAIGCGMKQ